MSNPNKSTRTVLRWTHLLTGILTGAFVYTPAHDNEVFVLLMRAAGLPAVTLTGLWTWQQARIRSLYRLLRRDTRPDETDVPKPTEETRRNTPVL